MVWITWERFVRLRREDVESRKKVKRKGRVLALPFFRLFPKNGNDVSKFS